MKIVSLKHSNKRYVKKVAILQTQLWSCDKNELRSYIRGIKEMLKASNYHLLCAIDEHNNVVGYIELYISYSLDEVYYDTPVVRIDGLYVSEKHKRTGIGSLLVKEAEKFGFEKYGCKNISSTYLQNNKISESFHHSLGFQETNKIISVIKDINFPD